MAAFISEQDQEEDLIPTNVDMKPWKVRQVNPQTLKAEFREVEYEQQFVNHKPVIIGMQEARFPETDIRHVGIFVEVASAHCRGQYGNAVWFNTQIAYAYSKNKPLFFTQEDFRIVYSEPRVLVIEVDTPVLKCYVCSIHCPHPQKMQHAKAWYSRVCPKLRKFTDRPRLVFCDGNTEVDIHAGLLFGGVGSYSPGKLFAQFGNSTRRCRHLL